MKMKIEHTCGCGETIKLTFVEGALATRLDQATADRIDGDTECPECGEDIDHKQIMEKMDDDPGYDGPEWERDGNE